MLFNKQHYQIGHFIQIDFEKLSNVTDFFVKSYGDIKFFTRIDLKSKCFKKITLMKNDQII